MNCKKCGSAITNLDQTCPNCGEPNELFTGNVNSTPIPEVPVAPVAPVSPVEPVAPSVEVPVAPVAPVAPSIEVPAAPVEPVAPVAPVSPVAPVAPSVEVPAATVEPVAPSIEVPVAPVEPVAPSIEVPTTQAEPLQPNNIPMQSFSDTPTQNTMDGSSINTIQNTPAKPKKNKLFVIVIVIISLIVVGLGVFIGIKFFGGGNNNGDEVTEIDTIPTEEETKAEELSYAGLTFTLPTNVKKKEFDGVTVFLDSKGGFLFTLPELSNEVTLDEVKSTFTSAENTIKESITSQGGNYISLADFTTSGRTFYGISYLASDTIYTEKYFTQILDSSIAVGEVSYVASSKDSAYKALNDFLASAKLKSTGSFTSTKDKATILGTAITVRKEIE